MLQADTVMQPLKTAVANALSELDRNIKAN